MLTILLYILYTILGIYIAGFIFSLFYFRDCRGGILSLSIFWPISLGFIVGCYLFAKAFEGYKIF